MNAVNSVEKVLHDTAKNVHDIPKKQIYSIETVITVYNMHTYSVCRALILAYNTHAYFVY